MEYRSILFDRPLSPMNKYDSSSFLHDIHVDRIIQDILKGREEYELEPLFYNKLELVESIRYRVAIMQEIDHSLTVHALVDFSQSMRKVHEYAKYSQLSLDKDQQMKWQLDAAYLYCEALVELQHRMAAAELQSQGLMHVFEWLTHYIHTASFTALYKETSGLYQEFSQMRFRMTVADGKIKVSANDDEQDYCKALSAVLLQGLEQEQERHYEIRMFAGLHLSEVEKNLLQEIKKLDANPFLKLRDYYSKYLNFIEPAVMMFERELQFYAACLQYFHSLDMKGLSYCYPTITDTKELHIKGGYDLSLASSELHTDQAVVGNHLRLEAEDRICVLTGPNQGGKTTFTRSLGQIFHLSSIGCAVPAEEAVVFDFDRIFTHFPTQEQPGTDSGKLEDELIRLKPIMDHSTSRSVVLLNELFFTTATHDAYTMGSKVLHMLRQRGAMCLYVTHVFELATSHEGIVSLIAVTDELNSDKRTFQIRRQPADGYVHASSIVGKYGLTRQRIKERLQS